MAAAAQLYQITVLHLSTTLTGISEYKHRPGGTPIPFLCSLRSLTAAHPQETGGWQGER